MTTYTAHFYLACSVEIEANNEMEARDIASDLLHPLLYGHDHFHPDSGLNERAAIIDGYDITDIEEV